MALTAPNRAGGYRGLPPEPSESLMIRWTMNILNLLKWIATHPLNRREPLGPVKGLGRFFQWQIASRVLPAGSTLPFVDQTVLLVERGMTGATGNWYCGLHEPSEMGFLLHSLRPDDTFVDVGANVGSYTLLAGTVGAQVVSLEPIPNTFRRLRNNVHLNMMEGRTELLNLGVSKESGSLRFTRSLDTMNRVALPGEVMETVAVPVRSLDEILYGRSASLLKIDVEGHELAVLEGAQATLANPTLRAVIMETNSAGNKYGVSDQQLFQNMEYHGFRLFAYNPIRRQLSASVPGRANSIFLRDPELVEATCKSAPTYQLCNGSI
ncbi:FkbM family methyltransferase [Bradyrhizobium forestalis]|uniref:FkbM family methyltransferase n=1 Tax=Bradyrhizobium forestalis TaxID=1419263 RepID=A0A2M8RCT9_9BRAD|nr:FkbM family methyltransferase [Bradyrhizobium forestalis]PJG55635.1 FkbM family methyltransferase [Bradyrhizobium forestalis]